MFPLAPTPSVETNEPAVPASALPEPPEASRTFDPPQSAAPPGSLEPPTGPAGPLPPPPPDVGPASPILPPSGGRGGRLRVGIAAGLAGLLAGGAVVAVARGTGGSSRPGKPVVAPGPVSGSPTAQLDVKAVLAKVEPAVVSITSTVPTGFGTTRAAGTGMVIKSQGEVLTNAHVVAGASRIQVAVPKMGTHSGHLMGIDRARDIAVLRVDGVSNLPTVTLGSSAGLQVGDPVVAVGNALALDGAPTVTTGIVSALDRRIDTQEGTLEGLVQTDAPINRGNSGGPLLDAGGRVVGMDTAVAGDAQNIGFAIPVDEIRSELTDLERGATRPAATAGFLGVQLADATPGSGASVVAVEPGSPAAAAGIAVGDVVVAVDGSTVANASDLVGAVRRHHAGDHLRLRITRRSTPRDVDVTLAARPDVAS